MPHPLPVTALDRAIARTRLDLRRGLWTLATFAHIVAPLGAVGMLAELSGVLTPLWRCSHARYGCGCIAWGFSEAYVPFALGLFLSITFRLTHHALDSWCNHLCRQLDIQ